MDRAKQKSQRRQRAHLRVRKSVSGKGDRPRLAVYKSLKYVYAQVIDDETGQTLAQANSRESTISGKAEGRAKSTVAARLVGEAIAERAKTKGISRVVFDRGGYIYHGRVRQVAEGARDKGLKF